MTLENPELHELTAEQIELLQKSWEIPSASPSDSGEIIFYTFFEKHPAYQAEFANFKDLALNELKGNPKFRSHATKIFNAFTTAISSVGSTGLEDQISKLAKYHVQRNLTDKKKFNDLRLVVMEVVTNVCKLDDAGTTAWNAFLDNFFFYLFKHL